MSAPVQAFLRTASDAMICEQLIAPVEWDTEAEEAPEVVQEIKDRLVVLGQTSGVTPEKAESVAAHLYEIAYGTATRQKDRFLTRAEVLRVFHERTHVSMPTAIYDVLLATIPRHLATPGVEGSGVLPLAVGGQNWAVGRPPPLPSRYYARGTVLGDIERRLAAYPILVLLGGTGVGKSVTAAGHAAASTSIWVGVNLRGVRSGALKNMLDRVVAELTAEGGLTHVVLDDIELPAPIDLAERPRRTCQVKHCANAGVLSETKGQIVVAAVLEQGERPFEERVKTVRNPARRPASSARLQSSHRRLRPGS